MTLTINKEYKEVLSGSSEFPNKCNCINCSYEIEKRFSSKRITRKIKSDMVSFRTIISGTFDKKFHLTKI